MVGRPRPAHRPAVLRPRRRGERRLGQRGARRRRLGCAGASNGNLIKARPRSTSPVPHLLRGRNYRTDSGARASGGVAADRSSSRKSAPELVNQYVVNRAISIRASRAVSTAPPTSASSAATPTGRSWWPRRSPGCVWRPATASCTSSAAAAGWGDALARDPAAVLDDVWDEYVSIDAAREALRSGHHRVARGPDPGRRRARTARRCGQARPRRDRTAPRVSDLRHRRRRRRDVHRPSSWLRLDGSVVLEKITDNPRGPVRRGPHRPRRARRRRAGQPRGAPGRTGSIVHGTTTGDNCDDQMRGAPTGLLVTAGFRARSSCAAATTGGHLGPGVPRAGTPSRAAGSAWRSRAAHRRGRGRHATRRGGGAARHPTAAPVRVTSIAVRVPPLLCERRPERRARGTNPRRVPRRRADLPVTRGVPKPPEFERTSTTLVNAFVGPPIVRYLRRLEGRVRPRGSPASCSSRLGRCGSPPRTRSGAARRDDRSGPTGGVVAAAAPPTQAGLGTW